MKLKHAVNLHKGLTFFYVVALMFYYDNFTMGAWIYLALHGTYGFMWLLKDQVFPDRQWEKQVSKGFGVFAWCALGLYWIAPWLLISLGLQPSPPVAAGAIIMTVFGTMIHFASDAQKFFTLKYRPGLITEGFFARCRNTNYLGELLIYCGFALAAVHPFAFAGIAIFFVAEFVPNMLKKEKSLSRYSEFAEYRKRSGFLFPWFFN